MNNILKKLAILAFLLEIGMTTFLTKKMGYYISPMILFGVSMFVGGVALKLSFEKTSSQITTNPTKNKQLIALFISLFGIICSIFLLKGIFKDYPIGRDSDIIPQVRFLVQRCFNGEFPYQVVHFSGYDLFPTYLPLQWLPFSVAELLNFDYRWLSFAILIIAIFIYQGSLFSKNLSNTNFIVLSLIPYFILWSVAFFSPINLGVTIETLIAGYYLILVLTISHKSFVINSIGLILCLLSRYSIVFWVPLYVLVLFLKKEKKKTIKIVSLIGIAILLVYIIPFFIRDSSIFLNGYKYHTKAAIGEWSGQSWQKSGDKPCQLFQGVGFACYFYELIKGDISRRLFFLQKFHLIFCTLIIALLSWIFIAYKEKIDSKTFLLASVKIYLSVFYSFIQIPYSYLFMIPLFISLPILILFLENKN